MTIEELIKELQYYKPDAKLLHMDNKELHVCLIGVHGQDQSKADKVYIGLDG